MKNAVQIGFIMAVASLSFSSLASDYDGLTCSGKKNAIQTQIDYAKKANNTYQVQGLEKALSDVNTYCNNSDLEKKYKVKIQDKLKDIREQEVDLQEAKLKGDAAKIAKREAKLSEDQRELKNAQDQLEAFYKALKAE